MTYTSKSLKWTALELLAGIEDIDNHMILLLSKQIIESYSIISSAILRWKVLSTLIAADLFDERNSSIAVGCKLLLFLYFRDRPSKPNTQSMNGAMGVECERPVARAIACLSSLPKLMARQNSRCVRCSVAYCRLCSAA